MFHPGTQHSWQTALAFQESRQLRWYATSVFYDPAKWPYRLERVLPGPYADRAHRQLIRRYNSQLDPTVVRQMGWAEWLAIFVSSKGLGGLADKVRRRAVREFGRDVIKLIEREPVDVVWGYDTVSLDVFRWAKRHGLYCVLDRTTIHSVAQNEVCAEEYARRPEFFISPFVPKPKEVLEQEQEEIDLADIVVVGNQICADTLIRHGCAPEKVHVLAYGFDESLFPREFPQRTTPRDRPIDLLFVGNIIGTKGIAFLMDAIMNIRPQDVSLTLVGRLSIPPQTAAKYQKRVTYAPTVSRAEVVRYFLNADCFVFPSIFEGGPIVLREIYGAGLGAIHSFAAGDGVISGQNGLVLQKPTANDLVRAIERLIDDRELALHWQQSSWNMRETATWSAYRQRARNLLGSVG
ncbi:MAG: hypothetical protein JWM91_2722 [Rhodospirillales bacterium]|nr:hypothetical protein [Rhodospirillales bacterium]